MIETAGPAWVDAGPFPAGHTLTGHFNILRDFRSLVLGNTRHVFVYLPPRYDDERGRRYPVLYMQDGQNLFDPSLSFIRGQDWRLDETAQWLIETGVIEPLIIVGVDHAGVGRAREFAPTRDPRRGEGGGADQYGAMLVSELKPWIDARYRTRVDAASTGIGGSSMGGLVSLHLALTRHEVFGRAAIMSPSLWWDRRQAIARARALERKLAVRIWLDAGTDEGYSTLQNVRMLKNLLIRRGWRTGEDLRYLEVRGGRHSEHDWSARAGEMLKYLFPVGL
jgi:predicted alpha/beta superfamily hydrolase